MLRLDINNTNEDNDCGLLVQVEVDTSQYSGDPCNNCIYVSKLNQVLVHEYGHYSEDVENSLYSSFEQYGPQQTTVEYILPKGESFIEIKINKWATNDIIKFKPIFEAI